MGQIDAGHSKNLERLLPVQAISTIETTGHMDRLWAPLVEVQRLNSEPMLASPRANVWQSGPFFFFQYACGGQILRRTIEHVERLNGYVLISRHVTGRIVGTTRDTPFSHRTGIIAIRNLDHPFTAIQYPSAVESILVPHDALKLEADEIPPLCVLLDEAAPIGKLHVALDSLFGALNHVPRTLNNVMLRGLLDLARIAIVQPQYASSRRRAARYGQYVSIQSYIEQNLHRLDLCAETLLPKFGVSRATLYRLFEEEGGVRNYIVDRRLFRALLDISSGPQRRGKIQQAAKSWGFSSAANFNRSVRHAFGGAPGSLFRPTAVLQADTDVIGAHPSRNILVPFSR